MRLGSTGQASAGKVVCTPAAWRLCLSLELPAQCQLCVREVNLQLAAGQKAGAVRRPALGWPISLLRRALCSPCGEASERSARRGSRVLHRAWLLSRGEGRRG